MSESDKPTYHRSGFGGYIPPQAALERKARVEQRAAAVFGNDFDGAMWLSKRGAVGPAGTWLSPSELAEASEEGCLAVLVELDRLDPVTTKKPLPESIAAARSGRKVRRRKSDFNGA